MHYKLLKRVLATFALCLTCLMAAAQHDITGTVKDNTGEPVPGAAIIVAGTTIGTVSDFDGNFALKNVPESANIQASFVGYTTQTLPVGNQTHFDIILKDDSQEIQEVVAVGYGTMKKSDVTGSIASVSTDQLVAKGTTSALEGLQGAVPGVSITQNSGRTNGGFNVEIRGKSSTNSDTKPIYVIDGVVCSDMDFLNPQDIERLDVLKDASSTAIYGSRATAGVIMITTKSGAGAGKEKNDQCKQKFHVSYDGYYGVTNVVREADLMSPQEFYNYRFLRFLTPVAGSNVASPTYQMSATNYRQLSLFTGDSDTDYSVLKKMMRDGSTYEWLDLVTQTGKKQNHYVAASGSTSDVSYHFGVGFTEDEGIYKGDKMRKFNFKGSVDSDFTKYVSGGFSLNAAVTNNDYANDGAVQYAYRMNPFMVPYGKDGSINQKPGNAASLGSSSSYQFSDQTSPLCYMDNQTKERVTYRVIGNAFLQVKPVAGLSIKSTYSPSFTYYREGQFDDTKYGIASDNTATKSTSKSFGYTWTNVINYNKTFDSVHSVDLMGMAEFSSSSTEKDKFVFTNVQDKTLWYNLMTGSLDAKNSSNSYSEGSMISYAVRANYSYAGKYMATATVRWDGSSKFADGHRWGSFPSFALAWRFSEEDFLKNDILTNGKLRLSYGVTGNNTGVGSYATQQTVNGPTYVNVGDVMQQAYRPSSIVNKEISWESSKEINVGVDFGFLSNRISGTLDLYTKTSHDLLYNPQLPLVTGGVRMDTNVGEVKNKGIEISATGVIIDNEDWNWSVTATFAKNVNELKEVNGLGQDLPSDGFFIGHPLNNVYNYVWDGIVSDKMMTVPDHEIAKLKGFTPGQKVRSYDYYNACYGWAEGMPIIKDKNGDGSFDDSDKKIYSSDPKWTGSLSTTVSWRGIDFSTSLYTKQGYTVESKTYGAYINPGDRGWQKISVDYYIPAGTLIDCDGVNPDGTYINPKYQQKTHYGKYPFFVNNNNSGAGAIWAGSTAKDSGCPNSIVDASYVKIKNITLGYTLPKAAIEKVHLSKVRVYCTLTNPFCFSDYQGWDPEWANASLKNDGPSTMTCEFGLNVKF